MNADLENTMADGTAVVQGLLDRSRDVVLARGRFGRLFQAYLEHARQWDALPDDQAQAMMRQGMAAATLNLALRPPDEFTAWTLNIKSPPLNFFLTGDNNEFIVTGRVFTQDVQVADSSRLFMESQRPRREPHSSVVDVDGLDVLKIFEQFYLRSEQIPSRLFEIEADAFVLVQGLPRVDHSWLGSLDASSMSDFLQRELEPIEERTYTFRCGCDPHKILGVVSGFYKDRTDELFKGENRVEVLCPRCGKRWWLTREEYELGPRRVGIT